MMEDQPLVSIVTPSYNQVQFIETTIHSVLDQDYPNIEYIVCDGGSTDGSIKLIQKYENRIARWVSEKDDGQTDAINRGFRQATGQIWAYINSDDVYEVGAVRRVVQFLDQNPEVSVVYGNYRLIDENGNVTYTVEAPEFDLKNLLLRNFLCQPTVFWRSNVSQVIGEFDAGLKFDMDYDFFLRAALEGFRFAKFPGPPLAKLRMWKGTKTSLKSNLGLQEDWKVLERCFSNPKLPEKLKGLKDEALANACIVIAIGHYQAGEMEKARGFLLKSFGIHPAILFKTELASLYLKTFLGPRLSRVVREFRQTVRNA